MAWRIGLYLGSTPTVGGGFQYSQTVLDAVASLPRNRFSAAVAYSSKLWKSRADAVGLPSVHLPRTATARVVHRTAGLSGLPWAPWRAVSTRLDPTVRRLLGADMDLWVFPAQDSLSYQSGVPSLTTVYDLMHLYERRFPEGGSTLEFAYRQRHYAAICRYSRGVLVDSVCGKRQLIESYGVAPEKVHVLPYVTAGPSSADVRDGDNSAVQRLLGSLPEKFFFYPARFWRHKNHLAIVHALSRLRGHAPDMRVVFTGAKERGWYDAVVQAVRREQIEDRVLFLGFVPDGYVRLLYARARALIMPTFFGPTNIPPLEAFAAGCAVAVSNVYGMPEQVGDAALTFDPADVAQLAEVMLRLWTDDGLCAELSRRGLVRSRMTSQDRMDTRLLEILDMVLGAHESAGRGSGRV